jgi:predicted flap endonuclease-1-like 5' DNA nuclease
MSKREFPEWYYAVPDSRSAHIAELEAALLDSNDTAARLAEALLEEKKLRFVDRAEALMDTLDLLAGVGP